MIAGLNTFLYSLPNSKNLLLPNIKYLWFLLSFGMADLLSDTKKPDKLTIKEIILKGAIIAIVLIVPSLSAFFLSWMILDDLLQAAIIGGVIHFIAMGFSLKISNKFFAKERI